MVAVIGESGSGKTFLAQHIAVRQLADGCLVVWLRAGDYEGGRLGEFVAQAMGPYSTEAWRQLIGAATESGTPVTVIVDGLNECSIDTRDRLLERLGAFARRHSLSVMITSTTADRLKSTLDAVVLKVREPDERSRLEILDAHGARDPDRISEQFRTPYELSIAARCEQELPQGASVTSVEAAYIRQHAPSEQIRSGLRALAHRMHDRLRTSLSLLEVHQVLIASELDLKPSEVDSVLDCRQLVAVDQHRVRFRHELMGQFLAAEFLVHSCDSGETLGSLLSEPANSMLARTALSIESDHHRVWKATMALADAELIVAAANSNFGPRVAQLALDEIKRVLRTAVAETESGSAEFDAKHPPFGRWVTEHQWSDAERAVLAAAGRSLACGRFVDEVGELIDCTDRVCIEHARRWRAQGERQPVSRIVAGTYSQTAAPLDGRGLAASYVARAFELSVMGRRFDPDGPPSGLARSLFSDAGRWSWGRFRLAALCVKPLDEADQEFFASFMTAAWDAGGQHLRHEILDAARYFHDSPEPHRTRILDQVKSIETDHVFLQSDIVEVLAAFGEISNPITAEQLRTDIRSTIAQPQDMDCCKRADSIVSHQFEIEDIFGPYWEAVEGLSEREKVRLLTMAARGAGLDGSFHLEWTLDELVKLTPTGDPELDSDAQSVLRIFLDEPSKGFMFHPAAESVWLTAVRGWAKLDLDLPPQPEGATSSQNNWRRLGEIFYRHERDDAPADATQAWDALLLDPAETIPNLARLEAATFGTDAYEWPRRYALEHLIKHYPEPLRHLCERALTLDSDSGARRLGTSYTGFAIRTLGDVGTEATAAMLEPHTLDPETGAAAVEAIRQINRRTAP